jgi:hypothetical protein
MFLVSAQVRQAVCQCKVSQSFLAVPGSTMFLCSLTHTQVHEKVRSFCLGSLCCVLMLRFMKKFEKRLEASEKSLRVAPKKVKRIKYFDINTVIR